jgi:branched-subunit amino acid ABC-type transport system permease component
MLEKILFQTLIGLSFSMYLWLLASGLTLVFGVLGVLNFAHGSLYAGAYATFTFYGNWVNFWVSIALSLISVGVIGAVLERFFIRLCIYEIDLYQLILTFGFILIFDDLVKMIWEGVMIPPMPRSLREIYLPWQGFPHLQPFIILPGWLWPLSLASFRDLWGRMIRASADREMASAIGINIPILFTTVFVLSAMLAALGGALGTPVRVVAPGIGTAMIIQAFVITVIGGLGNLKGAFVGALIVGILTSYGILLFPVFELFIIFVVMAIVLMVKPEGLFGK